MAYKTIAQFEGGPFEDQRREMKYLDREFRPQDEQGCYVRTSRQTKDHKAQVWTWASHEGAKNV